MTSIVSLPSDIIIDNIFPLLSVKEFLNFSATCKAFHALAYDEVYWRKLTTSTFRLPAQPLREKGWRELYKNLSSATLFTWGSNDKGRLGHEDDCSKMPFPMEAELPLNQVAVDVVMGGWSTTALTASGSLYTWGTLSGSWRSRPEGQKPRERATQLQFPPEHASTKIVQASSGRAHVLGLSEAGRIWSWTEEAQHGQCIKFTDIDTQAYHPNNHGIKRPHGTVETVVAGWNHSAALVNGVGIVIWFPENQITPNENELCVDAEVVPGTCYIEGIPKPSTISTEDWDLAKEMGEVIGIMAGDSYLLFLTKPGKVYAIDAQPDMVAGSRPIQLPQFSAPQGDKPMSYISGSFRNFAVFNSDGLVYIGNKDMVQNALSSPDVVRETEEAESPIVMPSLQKRDIVAIAFGDYHSLALTSQGQVLAWGTESGKCGCLGLGPPEIARKKGVKFEYDGKLDTPSEVRFDWFESNPQFKADSQPKREDGQYFVFNISAAGWHSGALALAPDKEWRERTRQARLNAVKPVGVFRLPLHRVPHHIGRPLGEASHGGRVRPGAEPVHRGEIGNIIPSNITPFITHGPAMPMPEAFPTPTCAANGGVQVPEEHRRSYEEHQESQRQQADEDRRRFQREQEERRTQEWGHP